MKCRAVLFDLDDTLLRTYPAKWAQHRETARRFYGLDLDEDTIRRHWGRPTPEVVHLYYGDADDTSRMVDNYRSLEGEFPKQLHEPAAGVLGQLSLQGVFIGIVTNAGKEKSLADLERLGLSADLFGMIQTFDDTRAYKPDPRVLEAAKLTLAARGIEDGIVYVGDSLTDYHAARDAGLDFIAVTTGLKTKEDFEQTGVRNIISTLDELLQVLP